MKAVALEYNHLKGSLPTTVKRLTNLEKLYLAGNAISGTIPTELGFVSKLNDFSVSLTTPQDFPTILYAFPDLKFLRARGSSLTGRLSDAGAANWTKLQVLDLANNQLTGTLPSVLARGWREWEAIDLINNMLSGTLPQEFCPLLRKDFLKVNCSNGRAAVLTCPCC